MNAIGEFNNLMAEKMKKSQPIQTAFAVVKEVDWGKKTMTATGVVDDLDYYDVLLGLGEIYTKPKTGSRCLIGMINNQGNNSFLIWSEEAEEWMHKVGDAEMEMKDDGFVVKAQGESLKKVLNDFIDEVNKIIVVNGTTINVPAVTAIKQRLNKILI
ncbi:hypothetical protein EI546_06585 [Aequorivita sp. H23M31]|uniref:Uncharacterized protein n=1 Tax=Aequorivita ciconiae TaxID=2494375 RepID=A0A410G2C9_9FLAO|nr:hypothetical protein [Aequorivita sp. H23M31]QAA81416.1 hypothetical protein EI546_06585 [Aequorivita sp. H23M31]